MPRTFFFPLPVSSFLHFEYDVVWADKYHVTTRLPDIDDVTMRERKDVFLSLSLGRDTLFFYVSSIKVMVISLSITMTVNNEFVSLAV